MSHSLFLPMDSLGFFSKNVRCSFLMYSPPFAGSPELLSLLTVSVSLAPQWSWGSMWEREHRDCAPERATQGAGGQLTFSLEAPGTQCVGKQGGRRDC